MAGRDDSAKRIRYAEWRPIGVCDDGPPNSMKAQIFSREDLEVVTAPQVDRHNWQDHPAVSKILRKYARKLARISSQTRQMRRPQPVEFKLVGTVLDFGRTPSLNQESEDGRVQLFQIRFEDCPKKKKSWRWLGLALMIVVLGLSALMAGMWLMSQMEDSSAPSRSLASQRCASHPDGYRFIQDLRLAHRQMSQQLAANSTVPGHLKRSCLTLNGSTAGKARHLLECYHQIPRQSGLRWNPQQTQQLKQCIHYLCAHENPSWKSACKR